MLKKIVKYGSSHAIIFDKALLELLDMKEGTIVKIKTDGTSLILTPVTKIESQEISPTISPEDSYLIATFEEQFKKNLKETMTPQEKAKAIKRFNNAVAKYAEAARRLTNNKEYVQDMKRLQEEVYKNAPLSWEALEAAKALRAHYEPDIIAIEDEMNAAVAVTSQPTKPADTEKFNSVADEVAHIIKKYKPLIKELKAYQDDPKFQHDLALLTEQYAQNPKSQEYIDAVNALNVKYVPQMKGYYEELKEIEKKYGKK